MLWMDAKAAGLKKYESDRPCRHGHGNLRYVANNGCVECGKLAARDRPTPKMELPWDQLPRTRAEAIKLGTKHFYPQDRCRHGHLAKRVTRTSGCTACMKRAAEAKRQASGGSVVFRRVVHKADVAPLEALYQALVQARKLG